MILYVSEKRLLRGTFVVGLNILILFLFLLFLTFVVVVDIFISGGDGEGYCGGGSCKETSY